MTDTKIPSPETMGVPSAQRFGFVRMINVSELEANIKTPEGVETLYALHDGDGRRLALFENRDLAFAVARHNEIEAVSVH